MLDNIVILLDENTHITLMVLFAVIVLTLLFYHTTKENDLQSFENNVCPYCDKDYRLDSKDNIRVEISKENHKIHYSCPNCFGEDSKTMSKVMEEYYQ